LFALFLIRVCAVKVDSWRVRKTSGLEQSERLEGTDRRRGRVFVCWEALVSFCSRVLEELP